MNQKTCWESVKAESGAILDKLKELLREGNIRRVRVRQGERTIAEFPLTAGVVGALLAPALAGIGAVVALANDCSIDVEREVRTHFGPKVFTSVVPRSVRLAEAPSHGLPITQYDPNSRSADAYYRLALEVVERG